MSQLSFAVFECTVAPLVSEPSRVWPKGLPVIPESGTRLEEADHMWEGSPDLPFH